MISYPEALNKILQAAETKILPMENVPLEKATGRILGEDVYSTEDLPSFDNSAMDGFCVLASETVNASGEKPLWLKSLAVIAAGDTASTPARSGCEPVCIEIMTGAPLPESGYDAVVRIEDVLVERDDGGRAVRIGISRPLAKGENVRPSGTDIRTQEKLLSKGMRVEPHHLLGCAALGITELRVMKKPRVAILSTGSELVPMETRPLPRGLIRNSSGVYIAALLTEYGAECRSFGILRDDAKEYRDLLRRLQDEAYDVVISTGAVSMGIFDFVRDVLDELGSEVHFHKASIRPGKPILFAEMGTGEKRIAFFGMPGNPVSTAVGCRFFLIPYLRAMSGLDAEAPMRGKLVSEMKKPKGLRCFYKARADFGDGEIRVESLKSQGSYVVSSLAAANCWVVFPEDRPEMRKGDLVDIYPLSRSLGKEVV